MRNFASPRALAPASKKKPFTGSIAFLLCAAGSALSLTHNASAVAGAPNLPNLNYVDVGPLGTPSGQSYFNPLLVNLTQVLNQPGLGAPQATAPVAAQPESSPGQPFLLGHAWAQAPVVKKLKPHNFAPKVGNLNHFVQQTGMISYPTSQAPTQNDDGSPMWNGQGGLPNAMQAPWHYSATNFDPMFRTPYWNERDGFTNDSFELGLANTNLGLSIFNRGLAYAGKPDYSADMPVWGGSASDVTRALFPNSSSARASL